MQAIRLLWAFCSLLILLTAGAAAGAPLRLGIDPSGVTVSGVTAHGRAVVFGITREVDPDDVTTIRRHLDVLSDDDGDGVVTESLGAAVPLRSMWVAVSASRVTSIRKTC